MYNGISTLSLIPLICLLFSIFTDGISSATLRLYRQIYYCPFAHRVTARPCYLIKSRLSQNNYHAALTEFQRNRIACNRMPMTRSFRISVSRDSQIGRTPDFDTDGCVQGL